MNEIYNKYSKNQSRYHIERKLLSEMNKYDLQQLIHEKGIEAKELTLKLKNQLKELMEKPYYEFLSEISKFTLEKIVFEFNGGSELIQMNSTVECWKYLLQLKYENKRNDNVLTKEKILSVKQIPIQQIVEKFTGKEVASMGNLYCPFHDDSTGSLKLYQQTNSFYCFGCQKGGTPIEFTAGFLNISNKEAIQELCKFINY